MNSQANVFKVLIITSNFEPESTGISVYSTDLAKTLLKMGFDVQVLTGLPHYPWWETPHEYRHIKPGNHLESGFHITRFFHKIPKKRGLKARLGFELSLLKNSFFSLKAIDKDFDVIVAITPSIACSLVARYFSWRLRIPSVVIFQDLMFAAINQSGITKSAAAKLISPFVRKIEAFSTNWSDITIAVSDQMAESVRKNLRTKNDVEVVYNYSLLRTESKSHEKCKEELGFPAHQFIVIHAGNIGYKQDLLNVVEAAKLLQQHKIHFLVIGNGNSESEFIEAISGIPNITHLPLVPTEILPKYLKAADALLINERPALREMSLPSKITAYASASRPIIAAVSKLSSTFSLLKDAAFHVEPGDPASLAEAAICLKSDLQLQNALIDKIDKLKCKSFDAERARSKYVLAIKRAIQRNTENERFYS